MTAINLKRIILGIVGGILCQPDSFAELKAFPTAEGYGRLAKGGRGGRVVEVTNLNDDGPGSLRAAVMETGPRTIVFRVSGVIKLGSKLVIQEDNGMLTVAGQTAPGKGICVNGYTFGLIGAEHVVMRFIRTRVGTSSGETMDGMGITNATNCIYDHCSISWSIDEAFSSRGATRREVIHRNITLQRTLISEALNDAGHDIQGGQHGFAASISGDIGSFHHNLLAHCAGRNWSMAGALSGQPSGPSPLSDGSLDLRNNVVYNWRHRTTDGEIHRVNFVNNYYKPGPASQHKKAITIEYYEGAKNRSQYYIAGNVMEGVFGADEVSKSYEVKEEPPYRYLFDEPVYESYVSTQTAEEAYEDVLADVGCNVPTLDDHDKRIIREVREGTYTYKGGETGYPGLIDNEADVGGLEEYPEERRPPDWDTDHDGMPDAWETAHGLDPSDPVDRNGTDLSEEGYTNLEMYLNELAGDFPTWKNPLSVRKSRANLLQSARVRFSPGAGVIELVSHAGIPIRVELFDLSGRKVQSLYRGVPGAERTSIAVKEALPPGPYLVRISSGGMRRDLPVAITR